MDDQDHLLLSRLRRGDVAALGIVLERYWAPIVRYVLGILNSRDAAEDIAQETFVRLWERREAWGLDGSVRALLFRVARNLGLDELRRQAARERTARSAPRTPLRLTPDEELESLELGTLIARAVNALPERRREVFILVHHHGLSYRETAEVLGLSPQTVANHLTMALTDLRRLLTPRLYDGAERASDQQTDQATGRSA